MEKFGLAIAVMVVAGEILKLVLPIFAVEHYENKYASGFLAALVMWFLVVSFSFVNTFGNSVAKHAYETSRQGALAASVTRPEHIIRKEIGDLALCAKLNKTRQVTLTSKRGVPYSSSETYQEDDKACEDKRAKQITALEAEIAEHSKRLDKGDDVAIGKYVVTDAYMSLADMFGFKNVKRNTIELWTTLLWTLLAEVGSAFGGLVFPRAKKE